MADRDLPPRVLPRARARRRPRVSLGVPVYRKQAHLEETVVALLGQSFRDVEVILADNGSDDATVALCRRFARSDRRVRLVERPANVGSRRNFQLVFELAQGGYFAWNRGHDVPTPDFVERGVAALDRLPEAVLWHGGCREIGLAGKELGPVAEDLDTRGLDLAERLRAVWRRAVGPASFGLLRTAAAQRTRLYQPLAGCDVVFLFELAVQGSFVCDPAPALAIRRMRTEASEDESVARTRAQLDPLLPAAEPPAHHVLQFTEAHLQVLRELPLPVEERDALTSDLFADFGAKFAGSVTRALDALADRVAAAMPEPGAPAGEPLAFADALVLLQRVNLGLLLQREHPRAQTAREMLMALMLETSGLAAAAP